MALPVIGAQRADLRARGGQRGLRLIDRGLIRCGIEPEQHVALLDALIVLHLDRNHPARDIGADRDEARLQERVVVRFIAAAVEIEEQRADQDHDRRGEQQRLAQAALAAIGGDIRALFLDEFIPDDIVTFDLGFAVTKALIGFKRRRAVCHGLTPVGYCYRQHECVAENAATHERRIWI